MSMKGPWQPGMSIDIDPITWERIFLVGSIVSFLIAGLAFLGELLGWWNDLGEIAMNAATVSGVVLAIGFGLGNASRRQADGIHDTVVDNGGTLGSVDGKLDSVDGRLDSVDGKLDKLDSVDNKLDKLDSVDNKLDDLDRIQLQLDKQTGVLDDQLEVLKDISENS